MSTVFPPWLNTTPAIGAIAAGVLTLSVAGAITYYFTPAFWEVGYEPLQPLDYSHQLHAGKLGIDCRYCHTHVEESEHANVPDTATCIGCHQGSVGVGGTLNAQLWGVHETHPSLVKLRAAYDTGEPIEWVRVHKIPEYAHFPHMAHIEAGVSCVSCHGRVDQMAIVRQVEPLSMGWCLDCHRDPTRALVDVDGALGDPVRITDLATIENMLLAEDQETRGARLAEIHQITPPEHCAACHY